MVKWGSLEVPELEYRPCIGGKPERWPAEPGTVHLPTGIRLDIKRGVFIDRGQWQEWNLFSPPGEDWLLHITTAEKAPGLTNRIIRQHGVDSHEYFHWSTQRKREAENDFLRRFGEERICYRVAPEPGSIMPEWTPDRRDALILLLFWSLERSVGYKLDPYPSTLMFYSDDVPTELHGTYGNPAWERMQ